jgi:hypothetical protein
MSGLLINRIKQASPTNKLNCWRLKISEKDYYVLPAHVAIYTQHKQWTLSKFLHESIQLSSLKWKIPVQYLRTKELSHDFAWAEVSEYGETIALTGSEERHINPIDVELYFYQPYDLYGKLQEGGSFGKINAAAYQSPNSMLLESIGVGFRGLSGALVLENIHVMYLEYLFVEEEI